jgi:hypothetical protein
MNYDKYREILLSFAFNKRVTSVKPAEIFGELVLGLLTELDEVLVYYPGEETLAHEVGDACAYMALIETCIEQWGYRPIVVKQGRLDIVGLTKAAHRTLRGDQKQDWLMIFLENMAATKTYILNMVEPYATEEQVYALNIAKLQNRINKLGTLAKD